MEFEDLMDFSNHNIYFLMVLARPKNNPTVTKAARVFIREPVRSIESYQDKLDKCRTEAKRIGLKMYIYVSVNARNTVNGYENFKKVITEYECQALHGKEDFKDPLTRIDKLWYSSLMKPNARATKYFLVDIDTKDASTLQAVRDVINGWEVKGNTAQILIEKETRNGYHFVTSPFDVRIIKDIENVEVKTDGLLYLDCIGF
jgi:hypothetical protein